MKATFTFPNIEICVERPGAVQTNLASAPLDPFIRTQGVTVRVGARVTLVHSSDKNMMNTEVLVHPSEAVYTVLL